MAQTFAIATLHVCRKPARVEGGKVVTPADIEVVPAGKIADISEEDFKVFEKAGAARRPTRMDRAMSEGEDEPEAVETAAGRATAAKPAR